MYINLIKQFAKDNMNHVYVDVIRDNSLFKQSCDCEQFFKQIDDTHVEVTLDTGYGHVITLLFVNEGLQRNRVSVKQIAYFGDLLNIVNLRRHGFYDDADLLNSSDYDGNSVDFFKTHAKKFADCVPYNSTINDAIQRAIDVGMKQLFKKGLSKEALVKKSQYEQSVTDNKTIYDLVKTHEETAVQKAIKSIIDRQHEETIQTSTYTYSTVKELFTDPYTNKTYSKIEIVDSVVSNPDNFDKSKIAVKNGLNFEYTLRLDNDTQEMTIVDDVAYQLDDILAYLHHGVFSNIKYAKGGEFYYNARREILDKCKFMDDDIRRNKVTLEQVKKLVQAFIESIDRVNRLIAFQANVAID